jgi:hypothetical protein
LIFSFLFDLRWNPAHASYITHASQKHLQFFDKVFTNQVAIIFTALNIFLGRLNFIFKGKFVKNLQITYLYYFYLMDHYKNIFHFVLFVEKQTILPQSFSNILNIGNQST